MSAPIYDLLKRPDELFVVEHAHLQPRFVEDSVRARAARRARRRSRSSTTTTSSSRGRSTSRRSTSTTSSPSASGTVGELRGELATGEPAPRQTTLAAWLAGSYDARQGAAARSGARCRARRRRMFWRCSDDHRSGRRAIAKTTIGHGSPKSSDERARSATRGHDRRDRRVARQRRRPRSRPRRSRAPTSGASARVAPPASRPSSRPSRSRGRAAARGRSSPQRRRGRRRARRRPRARAAPAANPFATSSSATGRPSLRPNDAPDVRRADVPAPDRADVHAAEQPRRASTRTAASRGGSPPAMTRASSVTAGPTRRGCRTRRPSR